MTRAILLAAAAIGLAACGFGATQAPVCDPAMPEASALLARPEFEPLRFYTRVNYEVGRGAGFDIWADSKFEYRAALQYSLVPHRASAREGGQFCAKAIALRLAWPVDEAQRPMIDAFVEQAARSTTVDPRQLQAQLRAMIAAGDRYRAVIRQGPFAVEAGRISHPNRGDFFVVGFDWSSP
jgi:hypothetical protein